MTQTASDKPQIRFEATPNPATMIFRSASTWSAGNFEFANAQDAEVSPLAAKIFGFPWTQSVYLGSDFLSITKQDWVEWDFLAEPLADLISEHVAMGLPVYDDSAAGTENLSDENAVQESDSDLVKAIKKALDREIRPIVAYDGGDVIFAGFDDNVLSVRFKGACVGCPSKTSTLKDGIGVRIKELFPQIRDVVGV